jgi:hypothetical protein
MSRVASILFSGFFAGALIVSASSQSAVAADSASATSASASGVPDLFEAEAQQLVSVRYIPNDAKSAQIIVTNRTKRPLTLRLPVAFAGIPVLAQMGGMGGMGGGGNQGGFAAGGIGGGPQTTAGGAGGLGGQGMNGMGGGGMGMGGGGAFSIPPEKTRTFRVPTVCVEYGKREPTSRMPYKLVKAETFSSDPKLTLVLESLGRGELPQKVAQAAAWHISNGLTWEKLAAEKIDHAGGIPDEPYFTQAELGMAYRLVAVATEETRRRQPSGQSEASAKNLLAQ